MATAEQCRAFIKKIAPLIVKLAREHGYHIASTIIAQACLESGWGVSALAAKYFNYFGMKCGSSWTGASVNMSTKEEYTPGTLTDIRANFRAYSSMEEGVAGYFEFTSMNRYKNLKTAASPYAYATLLKEDGWATSSNYAANLMSIVTQYGLEEYDKEVQAKAQPGKREKFVAIMKSWIGKNEADGSHREIIDIYNAHKPLARGYAVKYTDAWCATTVSAAAIAAECTDIVPTECSCGKMVELFKGLGEWVEDDAHVPQPGEVCFYDWQDTGAGDNTGNPDHVGVVETCNGSSFIVIEGNRNNSVSRRTMEVNGKYIRGFGVPNFGTAPAVPDKSVEDLAKEVLRGAWGNGEDRKRRLEAAGYDYAAVQKAVNDICNRKSNEEIAKEVLAGKWGNGQDRKNRLTAAGYDYDAVQSAVNKLCR